MFPSVILVTGSAPPEACGVGDYTFSLAAALTQAGLCVEVLHHKQWGVTGTLRIIRKFGASNKVIVHIQYPTMGYGYSLGPQLLAIARKSIITLHEFSQAHMLRKLSIIPFLLRSQRLVITSEYERDILVRHAPWANGRVQIIPIGCNIPALRTISIPTAERVIYHGLIMPRKGLEEFLKLADLAGARGYHWEFVIIGRIPSQFISYAQHLMAMRVSSNIRWMLDNSSGRVAELLSYGGIAYLPFPDGASARRGSLKTVLAAAMPCITTRSQQTPVSLAETVIIADSPDAALCHAIRLFSSKEERNILSRRSLTYSKSYSWELIADLHIRMYENIFRSV